MDLSDVFALKPKHLMGTILVLLATLCPGVLAFFVYARDLFVSLELGKVLFLSLAMTLPILLLNLIAALPTAIRQGTPRLKSEDLFQFEDWVYISCRYTAGCLYAGLVISVLLGWPLTGFVLSVVVGMVLLNVWSWSNAWRASKRNEA